MGKEWPARSFKSGNSVAIRVPAALGIEPNKRWLVKERDGELVFRPSDAPKRKFDIEKVWGCATGAGLRYVTDEDRAFGHRSMLWDDPAWRARLLGEK